MLTIEQNLIVNNLNLVYNVWHKYIYKDKIALQWKDDIIQEGFLGLCKAAKGYDNKKDYKFSTFATLCIRNSMVSFLRILCNDYSLTALEAEINRGSEQFPITLADCIEERTTSMEDNLIVKEKIDLIFDCLSFQSEDIQRVMKLYMQGYVTQEIYELTNKEITLNYIRNIKARFCNRMTKLLRSSNIPNKHKYSSFEEYIKKLSKRWKELASK